MIEPIERQYQISTLCVEYTSLRAELLQRNSVLNQALASFGTVFVPITALIASITVFAPNTAPTGRFYVVGGVLLLTACIVIFLTWWSVDRQSRKLARRLREIEQEVNRLAGTIFLRWETERVGFYSGIKPRNNRGTVD